MKVELLPLDSILVEDRQRSEITELPRLRESIEEVGLINPILVMRDGDNFRLIAGERRLRAVKTLLSDSYTFGGKEVPATHIPAVVIDDPGELLRMQLELDENDARVQLSWADRAKAIARIHALRSKQAEARGEKQTLSATAEELFEDPSRTRDVQEALTITQHLDDPEVQRAKTKKEALRLIKKKEAAEKRKQAQVRTNPDFTLLEGDAFEHLRKLPDASFDFMVTDPPYGVAADTFAFAVDRKHPYEDSPDYARKCYELIAREGMRLVKKAAFVFFAMAQYEMVKEIFTKAGCDVVKHPLIWYKGAGQGHVYSRRAFRHVYDAILFCRKDALGEVAADARMPDDVICAKPDGERKAAKPVEVYTALLRPWALPGDSVLDPFAGRGTVFLAAKQLHLKATGIELDEEAVAICKKNMAE